MERASIYLMHKYWGKKPAEELNSLISKYSNENDIVLDPFSGFGGVAIESLFLNRNVIINDLNPVAVFISKVILDETVDILKAKKMFLQLKQTYVDFSNKWYCFKNGEILTILRDKKDTPLKLKIKNGKKISEISLSKEESALFQETENAYKIDDWYPSDELITNSRISVKKGMKICDLFSKRALLCHAYLYDKIIKLDNCPEKQLLLLAFTSNLANCSKLVPPIKSRGEMSQGAWMTGFYIGETYLENNVFHYFENRVNKVLKGKSDYLKLRESYGVRTNYSILNADAKNLPITSNTVDFVFTDFPYGDTVPYFEQSQLWNGWLRNTVDYNNEIVVSDSPERNKNVNTFINDINLSIQEIKRVLKEDKYFVFTFHSLDGAEWKSIIDSLREYNFIFRDCSVLVQKTLPPRQLNRPNSIKGDIVAVFQNGNNKTIRNFDVVLEEKMSKINNLDYAFETNDLIVLFVNAMLESLTAISINFKTLMEKYFQYNENLNKWRKK